ncbi:MAG: Hsp20/alpha crystallin family protein [Deltaproteobacteria bacterium]|nr:Hsp20/alpha crystallin family protein [Deltaproteobacteria bacterium]
MPELEVWKKQHINRLKEDMDRIFDRVWGEFGRSSSPKQIKAMPLVDRMETATHLIIKAEIPGIDPKDLDISVTENTLVIKGETSQKIVDKNHVFHRIEQKFGSFSRTFQLPCRVRVDNVTATYSDGLLEVVMPKCKPEKMRKLKVAVK